MRHAPRSRPRVCALSHGKLGRGVQQCASLEHAFAYKQAVARAQSHTHPGTNDRLHASAQARGFTRMYAQGQAHACTPVVL
eukprot:1407310-Pleurochrysis_carterae.AAC.1